MTGVDCTGLRGTRNRELATNCRRESTDVRLARAHPCRQQARHHDTASLAVLEAQAAAMGLEDLVAEREAQARSERLRGVERHEGVRELLARHASPPVRDADRSTAVGRFVDRDADLLLGAPGLL